MCDTTSLKFASLTNLPTDAILKTKGQKSGIRSPNPEESSRFSNKIVQKLSENNLNANVEQDIKNIQKQDIDN